MPVKDLTGQKFGKLTVVERGDNHKSPSRKKRAQWRCKCECGGEALVQGNNLTSGDTQSCGCLRIKDLTGQKFGKLTVVERGDNYVSPSRKKEARWRCKCECGGETLVRSGDLTSGNTQSCGCALWTIGGMSNHPLYNTWANMVARCYDPNNKSYKYYGAKKVQVYEDWRRDVRKFIADVEAEIGPRPSGRTLDRKDPYGNYEPGNLRWATYKEQANNKRKKKPRQLLFSWG